MRCRFLWQLQFLVSQGLYVLLDFSSTRCGPWGCSCIGCEGVPQAGWGTHACADLSLQESVACMCLANNFIASPRAEALVHHTQGCCVYLALSHLQLVTPQGLRAQCCRTKPAGAELGQPVAHTGRHPAVQHTPARKDFPRPDQRAQVLQYRSVAYLQCVWSVVWASFCTACQAILTVAGSHRQHSLFLLFVVHTNTPLLCSRWGCQWTSLCATSNGSVSCAPMLQSYGLAAAAIWQVDPTVPIFLNGLGQDYSDKWAHCGRAYPGMHWVSMSHTGWLSSVCFKWWLTGCVCCGQR